MHVIMGINECFVIEAGTPLVIYLIRDTYKYYFYYSTIIIATYFWLFFIPESPKFLFSKRRWGELHQVLNKIAETNGVKKWEGKFKLEIEDKVNAPLNDRGIFDILLRSQTQ